MNHFEKRTMIESAFQEVLGREPTQPEGLLTHAWALVETGCGDGWRGEAAGSNNWGAIQKGMTWAGETFSHADSSPNSDGTSTPYVAEYRKYPTPQAGATDLVRVLYTTRHMGCAEPAAKGDLPGFVRALYTSHYFEGVGRDEYARVFRRTWEMLAATIRIARELGEPLANGKGPAPDTVRPGDAGHCAELAAALVKARGFVSVAEFQRDGCPENIRLTVDGICGPATWALLMLLVDSKEIGRIASQQFALEGIRQALYILGQLESQLAAGGAQ